MIRLLRWLLFSDGTAIPFTFWLAFLFFFNGAIGGEALIEQNITGAFIIAYVAVYYTVTQASAALATSFESESRTWLDMLVSVLPLLVIIGVLAVWLLPSVILAQNGVSAAEFPFPEPTEFQWHALTVNSFVVLMDLFIFGPFALRLRAFHKRNRRPAGERATPHTPPPATAPKA